ncbi:hypothetical protein Q1695_013954 [Nippostrongylus brasiliensis]|nr:hypothetical protein Q1695_013954 [Nippostrongylus brasiliensis]
MKSKTIFDYDPSRTHQGATPTIEWKLWLKETGENSIATCLSGYQNLTRNAISVARSRVRIISDCCSITSSDSIDSIQLDAREQHTTLNENFHANNGLHFETTTEEITTITSTTTPAALETNTTTPTTQKKILRAPDKLDVQLGPIKETIYSLIYLIWHLRDTPDPEFTYRFEITPGKASKDSEWMPILETNKCCNVSYEHRAQYRTATIRMMIKTETETTGYTLSDVFILPNHRPSLFTLTMLGYNEKYVQLELAKTCETKTERLHYNSTDLESRVISSSLWGKPSCRYEGWVAECEVSPGEQIFQFVVSGDFSSSQQSEPLYFNPQKEQGSGFLELEEKGRNSTSVNVKLKEPFVSNPYRYRLSIFAHSLSSKAKEIEDTSRKRKFPLIVKHREYAAKIYFRLEYWLMKNASIKGNTPFFLLLRDAGLPNKVRSAAIKAVKSKHTAEYATFRVTWSPPTKPNGAIVGYKVRWKLERSPYTMYEEKLCNITEYELRLYWGEERYQVFISAATSKGYGPEKRLDVAIGSPPDWTYRSAAPDEDLIEQRKFVPQSRKELRYKYAVRRERVLIALGTVLVGIMFGYYLKRSLYPKPAENKPDRKHRKKQGDQENKE